MPERQVWYDSIQSATALGIDNVCLMDDGELLAYCLFCRFPQSSQYICIPHARANYDVPYVFEYMLYAFPQWWITQGYKFANIDADWGSPKHRVLKLALKPSEFFRKYTIQPA